MKMSKLLPAFLTSYPVHFNFFFCNLWSIDFNLKDLNPNVFVTSGSEQKSQQGQHQQQRSLASLHPSPSQNTRAETRKRTKTRPIRQHPQQETKTKMGKMVKRRMKRRKARWWRPCWRKRTWSSRVRQSTTLAATVPHCSRPPSCHWTRTRSRRRRTCTGCSWHADSYKSLVWDWYAPGASNSVSKSCFKCMHLGG